MRHVLAHQAQRKLPHDLEAGEPRAQVLVRETQQGHRSVQRGQRGPDDPGRSRQIDPDKPLHEGPVNRMSHGRKGGHASGQRHGFRVDQGAIKIEKQGIIRHGRTGFY